MSKYAEQYPLDPETGWIKFPVDQKWRHEVFPDEVFKHPAKANMYLVDALVDHLTKPGETILDPFGGTGTLLIAALKGRKVVMIELEPRFLALELQAIDLNGLQGMVTVIGGDCKQVLLDIPSVDHAIFSPPYSNVLAQTGIKTQSQEFSEYSGVDASTLNLGRLNPFYFEQAMKRVLERLTEKVRDTITLITKDHWGTDARVLLSEKMIRQMPKTFELVEWHKWLAPGTIAQKVGRAKGYRNVRDEDILVFRRGAG